MRLEQLNEATLTDAQRDLYRSIAGAREGVDGRPRHLVGDDGNIRGPFNHMLLAPDVARELVIMVVAQSERSEFEWWAHEPIARAAGVTDDQIEALRTGAMPEIVDELTAVVIETARALV